jgi:hypothetical protein
MACVGSNGGPYGFDDYSTGYFHAARLLWASIDQGPIDVLVYPFAFLYRQGLELAIKHLGFQLSAGARFQPKLSHKLVENWKIVRPMIEAHALSFNWPIILPQLDGMGSLLQDFEHLDCDSMVFRYPADRTGVAYLSDHSRIDLIDLHDDLERASRWIEFVMMVTREDYLC